MSNTAKIVQLQQLTRQQLEGWAGATIVKRGQSYARSGRARHLALTPDGALLAWVTGTARYATLVDVVKDRPLATCSCPYDGVCKHAVALVLACQSPALRGRALPTVDANDPRFAVLETAGEDWDPDLSNEGFEEYDDDDDSEDLNDGVRDNAAAQMSGGIGPTVIPTGDTAVAALRLFLEDQPKDLLVDMLLDIAQRFPAAQGFMQTQRSVEVGNVDEVLRETSALIAQAAAEDDWYDEWGNEPNLPDYSAIRDRLDTLLQHGYADAVVEFGEQLLDAGSRMVEFIHDEGEAMEDVAECLDVVFAAMSQTSLSPAEQMLRVIDLQLYDQYDMTAGAQVFWEQPHEPAAWSAVADALLQRLAAQPASGDDFLRSYQREQLANRVMHALEQADRQAEIIPLAEQEATRNGSYVRLVQLLVAAGRRAEAEQWIATGIQALDASKQGLSSQLRDIQRELWEQAGDWPRVAALRADIFFQQPGLTSWRALQAASEQAEVWPQVRAAALRFLETGALPATDESAWPLPALDLSQPTQRVQPSFPLRNVLIDVAIYEERPDEVLRWYDQPRAGQPTWTAISDDRVAEAVQGAHPERAAEIWKRMAEQQIANTNVRAYEEAAVFLGKLGRLRKQHVQIDSWRQYLAELRETNKRKRRLLEVLDRLEAELFRKA